MTAPRSLRTQAERLRHAIDGQRSISTARQVALRPSQRSQIPKSAILSLSAALGFAALCVAVLAIGHANSDRSEGVVPQLPARPSGELNQPDTDAGSALLRELAATTGDFDRKSVSQTVRAAFREPDRSSRFAAFAALAHWPDDSEFQTLLSELAKEESIGLREHAIASALTFLNRGQKRNDRELGEMWKKLAIEAQTRNEKQKVITAASRHPDRWAFAVVEFFAGDADGEISLLAERALEAMESRYQHSE